ncbi:MAG: MBL fold metallo-hydrolase [Phycisphaerae bacterium]|nr:MBL fold metallo-hydrolase [Phycisphaerae bacterium]
MSYLKVTLIDVGWGDSILIETSNPDATKRPLFGLIDSNDNADRDYWPSWNFLRKHFGLREDEFKVTKPFFEFVMLSHDHSDHGSGLKRIMQHYGTKNFWYPKVTEDESVVLTSLQSYAKHPSVKIDHQAVDSDVQFGKLGDVDIEVLWPPRDTIDSNPNNNSIVLALTLHNTTFLLTGDAEGKVWQQIAQNIPKNTAFIKVPHHGSKNGTIFQGAAPWVDELDNFPNCPHLGISCHPNFPNRFDFPHDQVITRFDQRPYPYYRTDMQYHLTFNLDENGVTPRYSH